MKIISIKSFKDSLDMRELLSVIDDTGKEIRFEPTLVKTESSKDSKVISLIKSENNLPAITIVKRQDGFYSVLENKDILLTILEYINSKFIHDWKYFHNMSEKENLSFLNYQLTFRLIDNDNPDEVKFFADSVGINEQQYLNLLYAGEWVNQAMRHFGTVYSPAYKIGKDIVGGSPTDLRYLTKAINLDKGNLTTEEYMLQNYKKDNVRAMWQVFLDKSNQNLQEEY